MGQSPTNVIKESAVPTGASSPLPEHERVYRALRDQVLFGELRPGQPVTIQGLTSALQAGMTPVREAIRRMTSDGGLVFQDNRRVSVPVLAPSEVEEILFLRRQIEPELARRACIHRDSVLREDLRATDVALDEAIDDGDIPSYLRHNHTFHTRLYEAAGAPVMAETVARLWLRFGPSLRVVCGRYGTSNLPDRHREVMAALDAQNPAATAAAIDHDITEGMSQVLDVLRDQSGAL